ncbi:MAG: hypothetical protein AB7P76_12080 [Candidatus Melainabacteria bacterium]
MDMNVMLFAMGVQRVPGNQPNDPTKVYLRDTLYGRWYEVTGEDGPKLGSLREQVVAFPDDRLLRQKLDSMEASLIKQARNQ